MERDKRINPEVKKIQGGAFIPTKKELDDNFKYVNLAEYTYYDALQKVLDVRNERQKIYADDWKLQEEWELLALVKMKIKRLEHFIIGRADQKLYENKKDCIIDATNYLLFLLQNILDKEEKK